MAKVYAFLADGFELVEALAVVDVLRRASVEVVTVSIGGDKVVTSAQRFLMRTITRMPMYCSFRAACREQKILRHMPDLKIY